MTSNANSQTENAGVVEQSFDVRNAVFGAKYRAMWGAFDDDSRSPTRGASVMKPFIMPTAPSASDPSPYVLSEPVANFFLSIEREEYKARYGRRVPQRLAPIEGLLAPLPAGILWRAR